ncbi:MAG: DUF1918 domain-containing protein [Nitriliruptorales bacterium]
MHLTPGDLIVVDSNKVGQPPRQGVVREIVQDEPLQILVTWDDGHESVFMPHGGNVRVEPRG